MSEENCELEFKTELQTKAVRIDGVPHTLKEMRGTDRDKWMNSMNLRMRTGSDGRAAGIKNFDGLHASLIGKCLYDSDGKLVVESTIKDWPASLQAKLFAECQRLNGLGEEGEQEAKND